MYSPSPGKGQPSSLYIGGAVKYIGSHYIVVVHLCTSILHFLHAPSPTVPRGLSRIHQPQMELHLVMEKSLNTG